jgi:DNA topoisomerase-3
MLKGTHIADLAVTEHVEEEMRLVAEGKLSEADGLHEIQQWIEDDIKTMTENSKSMFKALGIKEAAPVEAASGTWNGKEVRFKRTFSGHRFTDDEVARLLAGEEIVVTDFVSAKTGNQFAAAGSLADQVYKGKAYVGFKISEFRNADGSKQAPRDPNDYATGTWKRKKVTFKRDWCGHHFTDDEVAKLLAGETVHITGCVSKAGKQFDCDGKLAEKTWNGRKTIGFEPDFGGGGSKGGSKSPRGRRRR